MTTKMETIEILKQAARIKAIREEMLEELAAIDAAECFLSPACYCVGCLQYFEGAR